MIPVQIPKATQSAGRGLISLLLQNSSWEVLAKYRNLENSSFRQTPSPLGNLDTNLRRFLFGHGADPQVGNLETGTSFEKYPIPDAHSSGTMMPSQLGLIVTQSGRSINFITVDRLPVFLAAQHCEVVLHPDQKNIFSRTKRIPTGEFKLLEKTLVGTQTNSVQIDLTGVIHSTKSKNNIFLRSNRTLQFKFGPIQGSRLTQGWSVVG